jgi:hypothetical protein
MVFKILINEKRTLEIIMESSEFFLSALMDELIPRGIKQNESDAHYGISHSEKFSENSENQKQIKNIELGSYKSRSLKGGAFR